MKNKSAPFLVILVLIIFIGGFKFLLAEKDFKAQDKENTAEIKKLKTELKKVKPSIKEKNRKKIINTAQNFLNLAYVQEKKGYKDRKQAASSVMSRSLIDRFFPADTTYQDMVKTNISDTTIYLKDTNNSNDTAKVIAHFKHKVIGVETHTEDKTNIYVELTLTHQEDSWRVSSIENIYDESI